MSGTKIPAVFPETSNTRAKALYNSKTVPPELQEKGSIRFQSIEPRAAASVKNSGDQSVFARTLFLDTAAALGFPKDTLSAALLAFARFFSLPPAMLGSLRREFLNSNKSSAPFQNQGNAAPSGEEKARLESGALAAAATLDKGVILSQEAHANYARFLVAPEYPAGQKAGNETSPQTAGGKDKDKDDKEQDEPPDAEKIKAIAEEESGKDSLLGFLNSLPGKNGQYWIVIPFTINVRGTELKVLLRILNREALSGFGSIPKGSSFVIADISGPKRQWRCYLRENNRKIQADLRVSPGVSERTLKHLKREAERFLREGPDSALGFGEFGEILVGNLEESASWMEELCSESLFSINKEV